MPRDCGPSIDSKSTDSTTRIPRLETMSEAPWKAVAEGKKSKQEASIPKDWILHNLPSNDQLDVTGFPETCGLLSANEVKITNTNVNALLVELASGRWTAVEVTTAFAKRAIIAHQLVS